MPSPYGGEFKSFRQARAFARGLGLARTGDWHTYSSSGERPSDIPSTPWRQYAGRGWVSMCDWLGLPEKATPKYLPFPSARAYVRKLKFPNHAAFRKWAVSDERPEEIPRSPDHVYGARGCWEGWADFLGSRHSGKRGRKFLPFQKARALARSLGLKTWREWREWAASEKRPPEVPAQPADIYADEGWVNVADWLGYANRHVRARHGSGPKNVSKLRRRPSPVRVEKRRAA